MRRYGFLGLLVVLLVVMSCGLKTRKSLEIYALCYGKSSSPQSAHPYWIIYLVRWKNKNILLDTGFRDETHKARWGVGTLENIPKLLAAIGEEPSSITHVILTHHHWDHVGNLDLFKNARFIVQKREYQKMKADPRLVKKIKTVGSGLFTTFENSYEVLSSLMKVFKIGGHTEGLSAVQVSWNDHRFLFLSDSSGENQLTLTDASRSEKLFAHALPENGIPQNADESVIKVFPR